MVLNLDKRGTRGISGGTTAVLFSPQCLRTRRFGWSDVAVLSDRRDPEAGTQTLEMENQGFWAASDEVSGFYGGEWTLGCFLGTAGWKLSRSLHWVSVARADRWSYAIPGPGGGLSFLSPICGC